MKRLRYLIVPGRGNSEPGHWQSLWQERLGAERVLQRDWAQPRLAPWTRAVVQHIDRSRTPAVLIAHSFGCFAAVAAAVRRPEQVHAVFLAAPANPSRFPDSIALPDARLVPPAVLIASQTDPWLSVDEARAWARLWGAWFVDGGAIGHINRESGHGDWSFGLDRLEQLLAREQRRAEPTFDLPPQRTRRAAACAV